jgi:hypothetical protein
MKTGVLVRDNRTRELVDHTEGKRQEPVISLHLNLGELSSTNLHTAKTLFSSHGFVAWWCLWSSDNRDVDRETLNVLGSLLTENNFIYVKARSLLPQEIVYNKVRRALETTPLLLTADSELVFSDVFGNSHPHSQAASDLCKASIYNGYYLPSEYQCSSASRYSNDHYTRGGPSFDKN